MPRTSGDVLPQSVPVARFGGAAGAFLHANHEHVARIQTLAACRVDNETHPLLLPGFRAGFSSGMVCVIASNVLSSASDLRLIQPTKSVTFAHLLSA